MPKYIAVRWPADWLSGTAPVADNKLIRPKSIFQGVEVMINADVVELIGSSIGTIVGMITGIIVILYPFKKLIDYFFFKLERKVLSREKNRK